MYNYPELSRSREDMLLQSELYRPTNFWDQASQLIVDDLQKYGIDRFRSLETTLNYFVPTYGIPGNSFTKSMASELTDLLGKDFSMHTKPQQALRF